MLLVLRLMLPKSPQNIAVEFIELQNILNWRGPSSPAPASCIFQLRIRACSRESFYASNDFGHFGMCTKSVGNCLMCSPVTTGASDGQSLCTSCEQASSLCCRLGRADTPMLLAVLECCISTRRRHLQGKAGLLLITRLHASGGRKSVLQTFKVVCAVSVRCKIARTVSFLERGFI